MPKVSVIIPVYNSEKFVKEAVLSILNQTYQDFEIIVIDDASQDASIREIQELPQDKITILHNEVNKGISYSRNRGLEASHGEYIALLDHDDIAVLDRLECEVNYLDIHKEISVVGGHHRHIDEVGRDLDKQWSVYLNPNYLKAYLLLDNGVVNGSAMFRKAFVMEHEIRYRENMCGAEDYMFWVECSLHGEIKNLDKVLLFWRRLPTQETVNMMSNHLEDRNEALGRVRKAALEGTGFRLSEDEFNFINRIFEEECQVKSEGEIKKLYFLLKKIANQAVKMKLSNADEIVTMCRKRFGEKIGKAFFLWS